MPRGGGVEQRLETGRDIGTVCRRGENHGIRSFEASHDLVEPPVGKVDDFRLGALNRYTTQYRIDRDASTATLA